MRIARKVRQSTIKTAGTGQGRIGWAGGVKSYEPARLPEAQQRAPNAANGVQTLRLDKGELVAASEKEWLPHSLMSGGQMGTDPRGMRLRA